MPAESFQEEGKALVVTDGELVICVPQHEDVKSLAPCNQEKADTRMMLHIAHAAQHGHHQIQVRTVDTDVVVLAVMVVQKLPAGDELWVAFGTGKNYRYIAAHEIASSLGPEKTCALPMFHTITGCDTVSAFVGHGKKSAWATRNSLPKLTDALLSLANAPTSLQEDKMHAIGRFVILMYDRWLPTSVVSSVGNHSLSTAAESTIRINGTRAEDGVGRSTTVGNIAHPDTITQRCKPT